MSIYQLNQNVENSDMIGALSNEESGQSKSTLNHDSLSTNTGNERFGVRSHPYESHSAAIETARFRRDCYHFLEDDIEFFNLLKLNKRRVSHFNRLYMSAPQPVSLF